MVNEFKVWLSDNTKLYEALEGQLELLKQDSRALSLGKYGLIASMVMREMCENVDALCTDREFVEDFRYNTDQCCTVKLVSTIEGFYDFIYSPLYINTIEKSEVVKHLFEVYDHLKVGGIFILTFQDAMAPVTGEAKEVEVWYQNDAKHRWKVYTVQDLMETLRVIGFGFTGIEDCTTDGLGRAVSIICTKVAKK
ncbi:MAG: hypothetical protein K6G51_08000 [Sphaerochaetaceae bacterium]|nr:hypothetical protein [Sphaerochaetaceae bacterium]